MKKLILSICFLWLGLSAPAQISFVLRLSPEAETDQDLYLAGNFNQWQAGDPNFRFKEGLLKTDLPRSDLEFKVCGKSWDLVEAYADGSPRPNRKASPQAGDRLVLEVEAWEDRADHPPRGLEALHGPTELLFLGEERKLWIYLPIAYHKEDRSYPVLYLQDAQNLFKGLQRGSPERWELAHSLDSLELPLIVVAINHGEAKRIDELSPYKQEKYGGGQGELYLDFLCTQVKPYVDAHYRTLPNRPNTLIGGSSLGGLISLYGLIKYPDLYGGAMIFSPAYWFNPDVLQLAKDFPPKKRTFVYQIAGDQEGSKPEEFIRDLNYCSEIFDQNKSIWHHHTELIKGGKHNEAFWRKEFVPAITWLFTHSPLKEQYERN